MDLLKAIQNDVLKQKEEETQNQFSSVADFREFILASHPSADVSVSLTMCCLHSERLHGNHGTRVTLRKPYLVQVTVWDAKPKKGVAGKRNLEFEPGAVYKFSHADEVGFYADIAKESIQYELANNYRNCEIKAPLKKRKVFSETSPQPLVSKAKALEGNTGV
ncbi:hypothetical protein PPTG_04986 [Phytophthora nicotianae INRA-310]|uniref:Uncharacterized protein n=1 Tax=Phytophthora nicotianae (strain INRA-310) TaxID=761204 RepID=W2R3J3_PHYN3|nr:hypothetical protein PPTG_04986 [Phytophthora nicotianae INRA-310]ETN19806.1 hypothetical protein PPTG_04986 [Phytophthora nicotianae INRA-310]